MLSLLVALLRNTIMEKLPRQSEAKAKRDRNCKLRSALVLPILLMSFWAPSAPAAAAENLTLRKGISFVEDKDSGFPIIADKIDDATIGNGSPAFIFFAASGDLKNN